MRWFYDSRDLYLAMPSIWGVFPLKGPRTDIVYTYSVFFGLKGLPIQ